MYIWVIYGVILVYYLVATLFPIDKIIGRIYPIFGAILLLSAVGVFFGIFAQGYQLDNIDFSHGIKGIFDVYPYFDGIVGSKCTWNKIYSGIFWNSCLWNYIRFPFDAVYVDRKICKT